MGLQLDLNVSPAKLNVGVVLLGFREFTDPVHKCESAGEVSELVLLQQPLAIGADGLGGHMLDECTGLFRRQWVCAFGARSALLLSQIHGESSPGEQVREMDGQKLSRKG